MVAAWHTLELVRGGKQHWHDACGAPAHLRLEAVAHRLLVEQQQAEELQPGNGRRSGIGDFWPATESATAAPIAGTPLINIPSSALGSLLD